MEEGKSVHEAAEKYNVPKNTLGDRISGYVITLKVGHLHIW